MHPRVHLVLSITRGYLCSRCELSTTDLEWKCLKGRPYILSVFPVPNKGLGTYLVGAQHSYVKVSSYSKKLSLHQTPYVIARNVNTVPTIFHLKDTAPRRPPHMTTIHTQILNVILGVSKVLL